jgi:hypothetical protein
VDVDPIIGSEAIASGGLTRGQLRWNFTAIHPDVYIANGQRRTLETRAVAAWLWTRRRGIIAGQAAAALHGVDGIKDWAPIEIIAPYARRQRGVVVRDERIADDETCCRDGMKVTTAARTALDLARTLPRDAAVEHLDRLAAISRITPADVHLLTERHRGARGISRARIALSLMDGGTRCREETRMRLSLVDAGLPPPTVPVVLRDGSQPAIIGMGWEWCKVGVSFKIDTPLPGSLLIQSLRRDEIVQRLGWIEFGFTSRLHGRSVVYRVRNELQRRGKRGA